MLALVTAATSAFIAYTCMVVIGAYAGGGSEGLFASALSLAYAVLDGVLLVPAVLLLATFRRGKLTLTPWVFLSASIAIFVVADMGFAYYTAACLGGLIWHWDPLYGASYAAMAATLFWHNRFFIFDKGKAKKIWQRENR